jgi:hypothetical protein
MPFLKRTYACGSVLLVPAYALRDLQSRLGRQRGRLRYLQLEVSVSFIDALAL